MIAATRPLAAYNAIPPTSTPRRLQAAAVLLCLCSSLLFFSARHAVTNARQALQSVGKDCAPSIVAAEVIRAGIADLDANQVNEMLCAPGSADMQRARKACTDRIQEISTNLVRAAENITFGDAERAPINTLVRDVGIYESGMSRAFTLKERNDLPDAMVEFRKASDVEGRSLLPAADALAKANYDVLQQTYSRAGSSHWLALTLLLSAGALCLGVLVATQLFVARASHRMLNFGLLAATAICGLFSLYAVVQTTRAANLLRDAKEDAFDSVYALWKARALSYDANGQESRWLYDRLEPQAYEARFRTLAADIIKTPGGASPRELVSLSRSTNIAHSPPLGWSGCLVDELCNITFPGEKEAATSALDAYCSYLEIDGRIRELQNEGRSQQAVDLCLSYAPGGSDAAFEKFDEALGETLRINQEAFDTSVSRGFGALDGFDWLCPVAALAIGAAGVLGLWPRVREYLA